MIFFDVTQAQRGTHHSGLRRVSERLRAELAEATSVYWDARKKGWRTVSGRTPWQLLEADWLLTAEVFSEDERPGFAGWLETRRCRLAGIYHDAIPLRLPEITWPKSVARHPYYLKMLSRFDRIWAVSENSRRELLGWWQWQAVEKYPEVAVIALGADIPGAMRRGSAPAALKRADVSGAARGLVSVGIVEPRKNQSFLLEVCSALWDEGMDFNLSVFGRINPHFGRPIVEKMRAACRVYPKFHYSDSAGDAEVDLAFRASRASVFPTLAEGCGLPLLESLWRGVPCVCSDLPVLRENSAAGGCLAVALHDRGAWINALRKILTDDMFHAAKVQEAVTRALPTWAEAAQMLRENLRD